MQAIKEYWEKATPMSFAGEKWSYEQKRNFRYSLQDYMHDVFRFEEWEWKQVLEIGCGSGIDAIEFARNGATVVAADITDNALRQTMQNAVEAGVPIIVCLPQSNQGLPLNNNSFDLVYSFGVLHHIPNVQDILTEAHRVLKPNGKIMAMLYHKDSLLYAYSIIHQHRGNSLNADALTRMYSERIEGCPYTKVYNKNEARELFNPWFGNIEISIHYNVLDLPGQRKVKFDIDDKWELGWHLVIKGTKA